MGNYLLSLIRTWVPIVVGTLLTWLAASTHIVISEHSRAVAAAACVAVLSAGYYALVRLLERKVPQLGVLLGATVQPAYTPPAPAAAPFTYVPAVGGAPVSSGTGAISFVTPNPGP